MSEEEVYASMIRDQQQQGVQQPQQQPPQPDAGKPQPGEPEEFAEFEQPAGADALEKEKLKTSWDGTMLAAVQAAKGRGDLPGFMKEFAEEFVSPKIGWWEVLRSLL